MRDLLYSPFTPLETLQNFDSQQEIGAHPDSIKVLKEFCKAGVQSRIEFAGVPLRESTIYPATKESEHWYYHKTRQWFKPGCTIKDGLVIFTYDDLETLRYIGYVTKEVPVVWWRVGMMIRPVFLASDNPLTVRR